MREFTRLDFIRESNRIEDIHRDPSAAEIAELERFMALDELSVAELERFVAVYQPNARLRTEAGLNVYVGDHVPPPGGVGIGYALNDILARANIARGGRSIKETSRQAYALHVEYETIHPFTDGNGRSGRALWLWIMRLAPLGFLHHFYYQALDASGRENDRTK